MRETRLIVVPEWLVVAHTIPLLLLAIYVAWSNGNHSAAAAVADRRLAECVDVSREISDHLTACHEVTGKAWSEIEGLRTAVKKLGEGW